ncbi:alkaline phosphatase family protein [Tautonia sociabilis]|nr:alkaline phosphatase family protein [Tautonia sociabilis]
MPRTVVLLTIPQLRCRDVTPGGLGSLERLSSKGAMIPVIPPFPGLAASAFASLMTGLPPREHGLIGNTYFDRQSRRVMTAPLPDSVVDGRKLWHLAREARPGARVLLWFAPNSRGAEVDLDAWLEGPGALATAPEGLGGRLVSRFGPFPQEGEPDDAPLPYLSSTSWILRSAAETIREERPDLAIVRVPYLGQVARRFGPDGRHAGQAVPALDGLLREFLRSLPEDSAVVAVSESIVTPVIDPVYPNRVLRELSLLETVPLPSGGLGVDLDESAAFALADHQLCHIYLNDPAAAGLISAVFAGERSEGVFLVVSTDEQRRLLGLDHPRAGDIVLVSCPDSWFAPDWWDATGGRPEVETESALPVGTGSGSSLDPDHVRGSLGAPPPNDLYIGVLICSECGRLSQDGEQPVDSAEVVRVILDLLRTT